METTKAATKPGSTDGGRETHPDPKDRSEAHPESRPEAERIWLKMLKRALQTPRPEPNPRGKKTG